MSTLAARSARAALAALCLAAPASADVLVVSPAGAYTQIQQAVDAAADGDAVLVLPGTYAGFTVDGKSLQIVGRALSPSTRPVIQGAVFLRNVPLGGALIVSGLRVTPPQAQSPVPGALPALRVESSLGIVRLYGCELTGAWAGYVNTPGGQGALVSGSARVGFVDCALRGGQGKGDGLSVPDGGPGGTGLDTSGSAVALFACTVRGGAGGPPDGFGTTNSGGAGGAACRVLDYGVYASGTPFDGGAGGTPPGGIGILGPGGNGLVVSVTAQAQLLECTFTGGTGNPPGTALVASGTVHQFAGSARSLRGSARVLLEGEVLGLSYQGRPHDLVWLVQSLKAGQRYFAQVAGLWLVPFPPFLGVAPAGVADASGALGLQLSTASLLAGPAVQSLYVQAYALGQDGLARLSSGVHALVLRCGGQLPDCNGNGALDLCDVLAGASYDVNDNAVPDECEVFAVWHVDAAAAPGGDGSAAAPFRTLAEGFAAASNGETVLVHDGVYTGPLNRGLNFGAKQLVVRSQNGPGACVIDCELADRAFLVHGGQGGATRLQGLRIERGAALRGGAISVFKASPRILDCDFRQCQATSNGGAIWMEDSAAEVRGCRFEGNLATGLGGGLHAEDFFPGFSLRECTFVDNRAAYGAGANLLGQSAASLRRCTFLGNTAQRDGGGLRVQGAVPHVELDHLLFAGNLADEGAGAWLQGFQSGATVVVSSSTFVSNEALVRGAHLHLWGLDGTLRDSVLWSASAPGGVAISNGFGPLAIGHTDLQGGLAAILDPGLVVWERGNLDLDPLFADPDGPDDDPLTLLDNDWRLGPFSPCIDAGDNAAVALDVFDLDGDGDASEPVPFDLDGLPRFVDDPLVPDTGAGTAPIVDMGPYERP